MKAGKLKSAQISMEELNKLKELANKVEDSYKEGERWSVLIDAGSIKHQIYSKNLSKWVVLLYEDANTIGTNSTDTSKEILELTEKLYNKYLKEEKIN